MDCSRQAPLFLGFPRQEYWSELPLSSPEDLPDPVVEPRSPALAERFFTTEPPGKPGAWLGRHKECVLKFRGSVIIHVLER